MTPNKRIALNVFATYARSLYGLVLGLFTARWVLMALGEVDFGLYGLVGGLTAFITFANELLATAVARFYAVAVGAAHVADKIEDGIEECRKWFNTALSLHLLLPFVLIAVGYPAGNWAIHNFLTIPADRVLACVWVWRFTCVSCFIGMANVPFRAMYTAKQEIAELTIFSFATATANALMIAYMVSHPDVWLAKYAFGVMMIGIIPQLLITLLAIKHYPECRFVSKYLFDPHRVKELVNFAMARFWTELSTIVSQQGNAILVNKYLGPTFNAAMSVGNSVASQTCSLSGALSSAFWPAIANKAGEGDIDGVRTLSFQVCRLGTILLLVFAVPVALEVDELMRLWLKAPPMFASTICVAILADAILERMSEGYWMAILGVGKRVSLYSGWMSVAGFSRFLIVWALFVLGFGIYGLCVALILARLFIIAARIFLGRKLVSMSAVIWGKTVLVPILVCALVPLCAGYCTRFYMGPSFWRICITTLVCEIVLLPMVWFAVFSIEERKIVMSKLNKKNPFRRS